MMVKGEDTEKTAVIQYSKRETRPTVGNARQSNSIFQMNEYSVILNNISITLCSLRISSIELINSLVDGSPGGPGGPISPFRKATKISVRVKMKI